MPLASSFPGAQPHGCFISSNTSTPGSGPWQAFFPPSGMFSCSSRSWLLPIPASESNWNVASSAKPFLTNLPVPRSSHSLCGVCAVCVAVGDCYSAGLFTSLPSSSQVDRKLHKVIDMSLSSSPTEMECLALSKYLLVDECIGGGGFEFWLEHG